MAYQKYKDIPNRREPLGGRDHIQHIENALGGVVPGPGEVIVGGADGPVMVPMGFTPPDPARTINVVGDIHEGITIAHGLAASTERIDTAFADLATLRHYNTHRIYVGDVTDHATQAEKDAVLARMTALDSDRATWDVVLGNHDYPATNAQFFGYDSVRWVRDLDWLRIIGVGPDALTSGASITLKQSDLDWLDARLAESGKDTIIVCHGSPRGAVTTKDMHGNTVGGYAGNLSTYVANPVDGIRAVIDRYPHVRAWLGGHSHTSYRSVGAIAPYWTGSRYIAHINAGSLAYVDDAAGPLNDVLVSPFVTIHPDRVEVRMRDHRTSRWVPVNGEYVQTIFRRYVPDAADPFAFAYPLDTDLSGTTRSGPSSLTQTNGDSVVFGAFGGENGIRLDTQGQRLTFPLADMTPGQGTLIARVHPLGPLGASAYIFQQSIIEGTNRIYVRTNPGYGFGATFGSAGIAVSDVETVGVTQDLVLTWDGRVVLGYSNDRVVGGSGYAEMSKMGPTMGIGSASVASPNVALLGICGFRRALSPAEIAKIAQTPTAQWGPEMLKATVSP